MKWGEFEPWHWLLISFVLGALIFTAWPDERPSYKELEFQRDAYQDSLVIARHEKAVLIQRLDTLQKIKYDEIQSLDSADVDSLLLFIANFPPSGR